jgi:hypothetical protein
VLEASFGGHDVLLVRAIRLLVVVVIAADSNRNPPRVPLSPLFAALGAFLGTLYGNVGGAPLGCCRGLLPYWLRKGHPKPPPRRWCTGQRCYLDSILDDVVRRLEMRWGMCIAHTSPRCLWPPSLMAKGASFPIIVSIPVHVMCEVFRLCAHAPLARLTACLGFYTRARTPCQVLGQNPSRLGSHPCRGGFRFDPLLASPRAARAQGRDPSLTLEGAFHLLCSGDGEDFPQLAVQPVLPVSGPPVATATFWLALAKTGHCLPSQLMVGGHYLGPSLGGGKVDC